MGLMRKMCREKWLALVIFLPYIALLLYFLLFSEHFGRSESFYSYRYNLVPFKEIRRFLRWQKDLGFLRVFINLGGNILAFLPFGFLLPVFMNRERKFFVTLGIGFFFVGTVELIQVFTKVGCFDVDDIILNMTGIFLGFFFYYLFEKNERKC